MDKYAVFGNPIKHSKSPAIHAQFAASLNEQIQYSAILAPTDAFEKTVAEFFAAVVKGLMSLCRLKSKRLLWSMN
jgi:Shikimate 5-dehydrogenase